MKNKIILVHGEPRSINSEIIYKVWKKIKKNLRSKIYVIGDIKLLKSQFIKFGQSIDIVQVKSIDEKIKKNALKIININCNYLSPFSIKRKDASIYVRNSLDAAHKLSLSKDVMGLINCPVNKKSFNYKKIGVTEYLSLKCKVSNNSEVMLIHNKKMSVSPLTTHIDINQVAKKIDKNLIIMKVKTIDSWFKKYFKKKPKIGVLGLNPHNAELRENSEEKKIIIPVLRKLKKSGFKVYGPLVSDTIFINEYKKYNVLLGMYHDQILSPFKAIYKFDAINLTLGLKYLRASPDHGVAEDLIGKNKASEISLLNCIHFINKFGK